MDVADPFLTFFRENPDYSESDSLSECRALWERQGAVDQVIRGEEHPDLLLETLYDQGIEPSDYVDGVVNEIDYIMDGGIRFETDDSGLLLPSSCFRKG